MIATPRMRGLPGCCVLARHPPARDFDWPGGISNVVDDEDVADETIHLGRDERIVLVEVEAVNAAGMCFHEGQQLGVTLVLDVVDPEPAIRIGQAVASA